MTQLNVQVSEEQGAFVAALVAGGDYPDTDAVLREAIAKLQAENEAKIAWLRAALQEGIDSGVFEGDPFEAVAREMGWKVEA